ncbi:MAG: McrB family protein [Bryobacteraceae bacterium]
MYQTRCAANIPSTKRHSTSTAGTCTPSTIPSGDRNLTRDAAAAFLDLLFEERGFKPLKVAEEDAGRIRDEWLRELLPPVEEDLVIQLLKERRYVILQGPPGTGKTRMARRLLRHAYGGFGRSIQFHPNTGHENFIGGLAPQVAHDHLGFRFAPTPGFLMEAAREALSQPAKPYLLHIDEINRADLAKVLGEAIFLLEAEPEYEREIELPYDFGTPFGRRFRLPPNLHILGTMNDADRSIALVDLATRRRFAFLDLWPRPEVVEQQGSTTAREAFRRLFEIFVEHASEQAFCLMPGHAYFLAKEENRTAQYLRVGLAPLLQEYLAQGYVAGFAEEIRAYLQWLRSL